MNKRSILSGVILPLLTVVALLAGAGGASALTCGTGRYLPVQTTWTGGTGPLGLYLGGTVGCANAKRTYNVYGLAVAEFFNSGPASSIPYGCDSLDVRAWNGSFQTGSWASANTNQLATSFLSGNILAGDYRMSSVYASVTWSVSWTYTPGYCSAN